MKMKMGMHLLPGEITTDILSRLPVESVIQCKLVCKTWQSFIMDPIFVALHARRFISSEQENHTYSFLLWIKLKPSNSYQVRFGEYNDINEKKQVSSFKLSKPISWYPCQKRLINWIVNSCNGLIVMATYPTYALAICNPCTREFVDIPPLLNNITTGNKFYYMETGFGYNPSTNEYKIVVVCFKEPLQGPGKVSVYTLGSGKWRDKGETSQEFGGHQSLHLNGSVYWVLRYTSGIVSFDLETEEFRIVPSPSLPPGMYYEQLGSLGGCLYVIRKKNYDAADVLVRNKEDHTWSWKFSITYEELGSDCRPLAILSSGKILWYAAHYNPYVVYYDPVSGSLEMDENLLQFKSILEMDEKLPQVKSWVDIIRYEKSFVSLKALGEMNARINDSEEYVT